MISSSQFFKKSFFTIQPQQKVKIYIDEPQGPWSQQVDQELLYKIRRSATKNSYIARENSLFERHRGVQLTDRSTISKSVVMQGKQLDVQKIFKRKGLKQKKHKIMHEKKEKIQTKLPAIKINDSQKESLRKSILNLQDGMLNFITKNNHKSLKKYVSCKRQPDPKFEMYQKFLIAAKRMMMHQGQLNTLFYNN